MRPSLLALLLLVLSGPLLDAEVRVPAVLSDHLVLQRDFPAVVWGQADPGESVVVRLGDRERTTRADEKGRWQVSLGAFAASAEPRALTIRGQSNEIVIEDVLVGEVWLCSGQSNMVWRVRSSEGADEARRSADIPTLRMFTGEKRSTPEPETDLPGRWQVSSPETVGEFSAVAFYFGRELAERIGVPIGLINVSWGGSTVEAWTRLASLERCPEAERALSEYRQYAAALSEDVDDYTRADLDLDRWEPASLPARYADLGHPDLDGVVWFRRTIALPAEWRGRELTLSLGPIDDEDTTYFAGQRIGGIDGWQAERSYTVPADLTDSEEAVIAVRVRDGSGPGGFHGLAEQMLLRPVDEEASLSLSGPWHYRVLTRRSPPGPQQRPSMLSNGMICPLEPLRFRGVVWYQGENNAFRGQAHQYGSLLRTMIADWRDRFRSPDLPFLIVQLPEFAENGSARWDWPHLRDGQLEAHRATSNTGLVVTLGLGDPDDIHPRNKVDVGRRAARWARSAVYGESQLPAGGPIYSGAEFLGDGRVRVHFETFGAPLRSAVDGELRGFLIAGADRMFHEARAEIDGPTTVTVWSPRVEEPKAVRYAWDNSPQHADLESILPASPFRTDCWVSLNGEQ